MTFEYFISLRPYMELFISAFASPLMVLLVVFMHSAFGAVGFELTEYGGYQLRILWRPYLLLSLVLGTLWQLFMYGVLAMGKGIGFCDFVLSQGANVWGWTVYLISLCCLGLYFRKEGIEGNIIGFVFVPLMLLCAAYQVIHHFIWVYHQI